MPQALATLPAVRGKLRPLMKQSDRCLDWERDDTAAVLRKIHAADGFPGLADSLFGEACHLFDAWPEATLRGVPGAVIARRETALLRATVDGAIWIEHLLTGLPGGQVGFLIVVNVFVFFLAFFLDYFEIAFIIIPLLAPVATKLGIDLIWFGVLLGANMQTSFMHPPFGFCLLYTSPSPRDS